MCEIAIYRQTAKWTVPNLPHSPRLKFDALRHERPSPKAGIHGVLGKVSSPLAEVKGFAVTITKASLELSSHLLSKFRASLGEGDHPDRARGLSRNPGSAGPEKPSSVRRGW
jgi:hypothetical protein